MQKKRLLGGVYYTFLVSGFMSMIIGAIMPYLIDDYHMDYKTAGFFYSLVAFGNLIACYFVSIPIQYFGKKKAIILLSSLVTIGYLFLTLTQVTIIIVICFVFMGISRGSISNVNNSLVNDFAPGESKYLNYLHMFFAVGGFLAPLMSVLLMDAGMSWKGVVGVGLVVSASMTVIYCLLPMDNVVYPKVKDVSDNNASGRSIVKNVNFIFGCGVLFFYVGTENAINGWLVTYLKNSGIMTGGQAQSVFSFLWVVMIAGRFLSAYVSSRMERTTLLVACSVGAFIMFLVFIFSSNSYWLLCGILGIGLFFAPIYPTTIAVCGHLLLGDTKAMGTLLSLAGLGRIIIPYLVGLLADSFGIYVGMASITFSIFSIFCCAFILKRRLAL